MKKLALSIDELKVVSFSASSGIQPNRGTVRGNETFWDACVTGHATACSSPTCDAETCACETYPPVC